MDLWKASYDWLREYKPSATARRINGTGDILSVIMKEGEKFTMIEFSLVDGILIPVEEEYNFSEGV